MRLHALRTVRWADLRISIRGLSGVDLRVRGAGRPLALAAASAFLAPSAASAKEAVPLVQLVIDLGRSTRTEILFDEALLRGRSGTRPKRGLSVEAALRHILAGTGIEILRLPGGGYTLFRRSGGATETLSEPAVAEILVVGRRLLNVDLPRSPNAVQPYRIVTRDEIRSAHRDNIDQYFRARVSANADLAAPAQDVVQQPGEARSSIDLRGVGANRTLVLVDGRRLPRLPSGTTMMLQSDLNGIPPGAVERVEILTSTAGGIYGSDATGGVVNVVLRRDYRGSELTITSGLTDRGDAGRIRIEGRAGWTSDDGATQAMIFGAYSASQPFLVGQRDYSLRGRQLGYANDPQAYFTPTSLASVPAGNAIILANASAGSLTLDPRFGGSSIGASFTYLPLDFEGSDAERIQSLLDNAGSLDLNLPPGASGKRRTLMNSPRILTGLFSARHELNDKGAEIFLDGLFTKSLSSSINQNFSSNGVISAAAPDNPFMQNVRLRFPLDLPVITRVRREMFRVTAGTVIPLDGSWRASAEVSLSRLRQFASNDSPTLDTAFYDVLFRGEPEPGGGRPALRPLADWAGFVAALPYYTVPREGGGTFHSRASVISLRAGGSVFDLPGGPLWLNLLAERRQEKVPDSQLFLDGEQLASNPNNRRLNFTSAYAEARAPLISLNSDFVPLRGLELQLAGRLDRLDARLANGLPNAEAEFASIQRNAAMFTLGARVEPTPWLMLRGSYATGEVTPEPSQIQSQSRLSSQLSVFYPDPKRGGRFVGSEAPYLLRYGGSEDIQQERATTLSAGFVINSAGKGPRLSADYSRIVTSRRIDRPQFDASNLAALEARFPERVIRAPLSEADRLLGFTGGPILVIDERAANAGRSILHAVEFDFKWSMPDVAGGEFTPYASATWIPSLRIRRYPETAWVQRAGFRDGPVEWRGNGGIRWEKDRFNLDINAQYIGPYSARYNAPGFASFNSYLTLQGRDRIRSQIYVDLALGWTLVPRSAAVSEADVRFGIQNLLDQSPPILADRTGTNYSFYGDPRRRRFELSLSLRR